MTSLWRRGRLRAGVLASGLLLACAHRPRIPEVPAGEATAAAPALPAPVEVRREPRRPAVHLLDRDGDPVSAVALALATGIDPVPAAALAGLVEHRLARANLDGLTIDAHGLGLAVAVAVADAAGAQLATAALTEAVTKPVSPAEARAVPVRARLAALSARTTLGPQFSASAGCAGEPTLRPGATPAAVDLAALERWRASAHGVATAAIAAVGSQEVLAAVARAVAKGPSWPEGTPASDPWPARDSVGVDPGAGAPSLALALRTGDPNAAAAAARALGDPAGPLVARLRAVDAGWRLDRVTATSRVSGACLRLEITAGDATPAPSLERVARVAHLGLDEATRALAQPTKGAFALEQRIVGATDPRAAARLAAWRGLTNVPADGPLRTIVAYGDPSTPPGAEAKPGAAPSFEGRSTLSAELQRAKAARSSLRTLSRVERGQGEVWALLASRCGTAGESAATAGLRALALRSLARAHSRRDGVTIEPFVTPDGAGLLAHAPRTHTAESPTEHAERVGAALGRVLVTAPLEGAGVTAERARLAAELGPGSRPDFWLLLDALAPGHPSWLEPRGTFASLDLADTSLADAERRRLIAEPLRLAVLASWDESQVPALRAEVERWLEPSRASGRRCAPILYEANAGATYELGADANATAHVAHLGFPLPPRLAKRRHDAELARWLLAREGGWLEQSLGGLTASATVQLLGGAELGALVVELTALPAERDAALTAVRELLAGLARRPPTDGEVRIGLRAFSARAAAGALEPRRRLLDLWSDVRAPEPTAASLASFLAGAFSGEGLVLVRTGPAP